MAMIDKDSTAVAEESNRSWTTEDSSCDCDKDTICKHKTIFLKNNLKME